MRKYTMITWWKSKQQSARHYNTEETSHTHREGEEEGD